MVRAILSGLFIFIFSITNAQLADSLKSRDIEEVEVTDKRQNSFGISRLKGVEGVSIYEGKKTEVILLDDVVANKATNNARQTFAKIPGLNIWESDCAGLQLGIAARGLSPNRTSNFNTRINGVDLSADALGYPEMYYSPPMQSVERIEIVRGAASLQYGTQFGGMLNFKIKEGAKDKKIQLHTEQTGASFGFFNSFNAVGGTIGKMNYYTYYQHKRGDCQRANSAFGLHNAYFKTIFYLTQKLSVSLEYTYMGYLTKQAGGLTDAMYAQNPLQSVRSRNWFAIDWNLAAVNIDYKINENTKINIRTFGLIAGRQAIGNLERINRTDDITAERTLIKGNYQNIGTEMRILHRYKIWQHPHVLAAGVRQYIGNTTNKQGNGSASSNPDFNYLNPDHLENSDYVFPSRNTAIYVENLFNITPRFRVTPGIRWEYIHTASQGYYKYLIDSRRSLYSDKVYENIAPVVRNFPIAGLGLCYHVRETIEIYANATQNFRSITFSDLRLANVNFKLDPDIKDEYGYNIDIGSRGEISNFLSYDLSVFLLSYNGRIGFVTRTDPNTFIDYRWQTNVGDTRHAGIESYVEADVFKMLNINNSQSVSIFTNMSYVHAQYTRSQIPGVEGKMVELVPSYLFRTGVGYGYKSFKVQLILSSMGSQYTDATNATISNAQAINGPIPAYHVADISLSYNRGIASLQAGCNNMMNHIYFSRRADGYPGPGIIPAEGRSIYITIGIKVGR
ncbi:MAG: TonB-dependent receptor [Cytophagales bacterium]|nr:TonB-dependent receptor [Cytophagales bacterium]